MMIDRENPLFAKAYGCMMGGAVGDALGMPAEGKSPQEIKELYGGPITDLIDRKLKGRVLGEGIKRHAGCYTDDTYLKHLLARSIIEHQGRVGADELGATYFKYGDEWDPAVTQMYITTCCAAQRLFHRQPPRECGRDNVPCNDAAMSIAPIGIVNAGNPRQAARDALLAGSVLQDHVSLDGAASMAAAVAEAMRPETTLDRIIDASTRWVCKDLAKAIDEAVELAGQTRGDAERFTARFYESQLVPWCESTRMSADVRECIPASLGLMVVEGGDTKRTLIATANFGRDCDTICGMAGGVVGAWHGIDSLPAKWVEMVQREQPKPNIADLTAGLVGALESELAAAREIDAAITQLKAPAMAGA